MVNFSDLDKEREHHLHLIKAEENGRIQGVILTAVIGVASMFYIFSSTGKAPVFIHDRDRIVHYNNKQYTIVREAVRNSWDRIPYKVFTGRLLLQEIKPSNLETNSSVSF